MDMHYLYMSHKRDARLICVNNKLFSVTSKEIRVLLLEQYDLEINIFYLYKLFLVY